MTTLRSLILSIDSTAALAGAQQYRAASGIIAQSNATVGASVGRIDQQVARGSRSFLAGIGPLKSYLAAFGGFVVARSLVSTISSFDEAVRRLQATTGLSEAQMKSFVAQARELGATTEFTATQVANAQLRLAQAGFSVQEVMSSLPGVIDLATVSQTDLATAANSAAKVLRLFGLDVREIGRVNDVLVKAAQSGTTTVSELVRALINAAPASKNLGVSLEELAAIQSVLATKFRGAEAGGRAFDAVVRALVKPTERAIRALASLGLSLDDVNVRRLGILQVIQNLNAAGLQAEQAAQIFDSFGARAIPGLVAAFDEVENLNHELSRSRGTAEQASRVIRGSLPIAFKEVSSAVQDLFLEIGERGLVDALKDTAGALRDLARSDTAGAAAAAIGTIGNAASLAVDSIRGLDDAIGQLFGGESNGAITDIILRRLGFNEGASRAGKELSGFLDQLGGTGRGTSRPSGSLPPVEVEGTAPPLAIELEVNELRRLVEARRESDAAYRRTRVEIEAEGIARRENLVEVERELPVLVDLIQKREAYVRELDRADEAERRAIENVRRLQEEYRAFGIELGGTVGDELERITLEGKNARDAIEDLGRALASLVFRQVVTAPLANLTGSLFSSINTSSLLGSLFSGGVGLGGGAPARVPAGGGVAQKTSSRIVNVNQTIHIGDGRNDSRGFKFSGRQVAESAGQIYSRSN